jgi:hypothetical protein
LNHKKYSKAFVKKWLTKNAPPRWDELQEEETIGDIISEWVNSSQGVKEGYRFYIWCAFRMYPSIFKSKEKLD